VHLTKRKRVEVIDDDDSDNTTEMEQPSKPDEELYKKTKAFTFVCNNQKASVVAFEGTPFDDILSNVLNMLDLPKPKRHLPKSPEFQSDPTIPLYYFCRDPEKRVVVFHTSAFPDGHTLELSPYFPGEKNSVVVPAGPPPLPPKNPTKSPSSNKMEVDGPASQSVHSSQSFFSQQPTPLDSSMSRPFTQLSQLSSLSSSSPPSVPLPHPSSSIYPQQPNTSASTPSTPSSSFSSSSSPSPSTPSADIGTLLLNAISSEKPETVQKFLTNPIVVELIKNLHAQAKLVGNSSQSQGGNSTLGVVAEGEIQGNPRPPLERTEEKKTAENPPQNMEVEKDHERPFGTRLYPDLSNFVGIPPPSSSTTSPPPSSAPSPPPSTTPHAHPSFPLPSAPPLSQSTEEGGREGEEGGEGEHPKKRRWFKGIFF
jgi:hypothetical protein